jgi:hypothetical protein
VAAHVYSDPVAATSGDTATPTDVTLGVDPREVDAER